MSKDNNTQAPQQGKEWRGYSYDELVYRQAYVKVRLEMEKEKLMSHGSQVAQMGFLPGKSGGSRRIVGKLLGALDYIDYAFLAYRVGTRLFRLFRRRR